MNLTKLFETQAKLDKKIVEEKGLEGQDLLDKKILALQVELGELAQNWRGFKFWSHDQEPRIWVPNEKDICKSCNGNPIFIENNKIVGQCEDCDGCGVHFHNALLEEYVDCLHFILSIGLELGTDEIADELDLKKFNFLTSNTILSCFIGLSYDIADLYYQKENDDMVVPYLYKYILLEFAKLGKMLGFTWEEVEQAYYTKNKENHERQENGY